MTDTMELQKTTDIMEHKKWNITLLTTKGTFIQPKDYGSYEEAEAGLTALKAYHAEELEKHTDKRMQWNGQYDIEVKAYLIMPA